MWWSNQRIRTTHKHRAEQRRDEAVAAATHLCRAEPRFIPLVERFGVERPVTTRDPFVALVGSILQQQVSMSSAQAALFRLKALCARGRLTPSAIQALTPTELRSAGLSRQKVLYVHDLAAHFADGRLTARALRAMSDADVLAATTQVHGVGRWTAEMLLIFCLERPDVWPVGDLGLRKALGRFFEMPEAPREKDIESTADAWRPYRSYATWYFWRSLEGALMPGIALTPR